jgi:flavin-dependent dehydrogenase
VAALLADVVVAGGGPAGLSVAIRAAARGFRTVVLERAAGVPDKACGEGLMPAGLRELEALGALALIDARDRAPFRGIRYAQEDGSAVEGRFSGGDGMGIRRTALSAALRSRAVAAGAELRRGAVRAAACAGDAIVIETDQGELRARLLVAADGLHSPLRRAAGLEGPQGPPAARRFGLRRHFALAPWTDLVEVYWADGVEAYVTPIAQDVVNVAFLWSGPGDTFDGHLRRFPLLEDRLRGATALSEARGAGPLLQRVRTRGGERLALVGDAAGYVDAITGQGLSLAFASAALLVQALPQDLAQDLAPALRRYHRSLRGRWLRYAIPAQLLLALARRPALRRRALRFAARFPPLFRALLGTVG